MIKKYIQSAGDVSAQWKISYAVHWVSANVDRSCQLLQNAEIKRQSIWKNIVKHDIIISIY